MTKLLLAAGVAALALTSAPATAQQGGERGQKSAKAQRGGGDRAERRATPQRAERRAPERQAQRSERRAPERQAQRAERRAPERQAQRAERRAPERQAQRAERRAPERQRFAQLEQRKQREARPERAERRAPERAANRAEARRDSRRDVRVANRVETRRDDRRDAVRVANRVEARDARRDDRRADRNRADRIDARRDAFRQADARIANRIDARNDRRGDRFDARFDNRDFRRDERSERRFAQRAAARGWIDGCPPGLWMKGNGCLPPGQANKLVGRIIPASYRDSYVPARLRTIYRDTPDYYYRYGDGYMYRVNRRDNLVAALLPLLGAGYGIGQPFPTSYMNSYVPDYYSAFYPDSSDNYYRYADGYVYGIDPYSGLIQDTIPAYGYGYGVGQMWPSSYDYYNVPYQYRSMYYDTPDYYYRYAPGSIYQVDRETSLITAVASLLTGGMAIGQPLPIGYDAYNVPYAYRDRYYDTDDHWYRYSNGNIYQVDPTTRLVSAIVQAIV